MPSAFTTTAEPVDLIGVGMVDENGVDIERAALRMPELQDENSAPLSGEELLEAAESYAERTGLTVTTTEESKKVKRPAKKSTEDAAAPAQTTTAPAGAEA